MKQKTAIQIMWEGLNNTHPEQWPALLIQDKNKLLTTEREQIEEAYWAGLDGLMNDYSECETFGDDKTKSGGGASFYYQQKYGDEGK